jgi:hypothetical protein
MNSTAGLNLPGAANQAIQTGFDPQQSIYNQQHQQNIDQTNFINAQNGVIGTPYGAGVANQSNIDFNNAWQSHLLQNQATGANTASSLLGAEGSGLSTGAGIQSGVGQYGLGLGNYGLGLGSYGLGLGSYGTQLGGLTSGVAQNQIADFLGYLSGGTSASNAQTALYQAGTNAQQVQNQSTSGLWGGIGKLLGTGAELAMPA